MDSKTAMRQACEQAGVKNVAAALNVSQTALYNQINDKNRSDPLQRFVDFVNACGDDMPLHWACEECNGVFIRNPDIRVDPDTSVNQSISDSLKKFSDVIREISVAISDQHITPDEAESIRQEWEGLKTLMEAFVLSCEFGYHNPAPPEI
ncbi:MAG: hypothetical protein PHQ27_00320 [Victivallales bacterium]|nr:hypothetical protein [Victivallales bacterium]